MENKQTNMYTFDPLLTEILKANNLDALREPLSKHQLDLACLQQCADETDTNDICADLNFKGVQKVKFKKLIKIINEKSTEAKYINGLHISDEVHDLIEVPDDIKIIIDTPEFQRLRELKQLGATYYVFPGAAHNRFEHSLGVMHLARKLMLNLKLRQPSLNITDNELYCVAAAGLLHDLGHGPFSHVFDHEFVPSVVDTPFRHESMSIKLIHKLFQDNKIEISQQSLDLICALVSPSTHESIVNQFKNKKRGFLFEIIANEENGIDVDKWDYFLRDSHNLSLDISFKYTRLLTYCRVIDDHICFHDKTNYDVQILFNTRYDLFKRVYSHKTSKAVEYMICDILRFANLKFKITDKIERARDFMELTDNIIHRIQWEQTPSEDYNTADQKANEQLRKAQALIRRLQVRDLYKCVAYILLESRTVAFHEMKLKRICDNNNNNNNNDNDMIEDDINESKEDENSESSYTNKKINYHFVEKKWTHELFEILLNEKKCNDGIEVVKTDIICQLMSISYGSEREHPLSKVKFYNANEPNNSKTIELDQVTTLHDPKKFREVIFRVYVKKKELKKKVENAFNIFCKDKGLTDVKKNKNNTFRGLSPKTQKSPPAGHRGKLKSTLSIKRQLFGDNILNNNDVIPSTPPSKKQKH